MSSFVLLLLIGSDEAMMRALTEQGRPLYDRAREMVVRPLSPAHLVREGVELMLPDESRFGVARHVGSYWNRSGAVEVDLVGGDAAPVAKEIGFVGSVKWREKKPFSRSNAFTLAAARSDVPGAGDGTPLLGVSSSGFEDDVPLDVRLTPDDLIDAWRRTEEGVPG